MNPLLLPVLAAQGLWVLRRTVALPEAAPGSGVAGTGDDPVRVLVVGESTAAGCGAPTQDDAFAGAFARALAGHRGRPVRWTVHGRNGATIRQVRHDLLPTAPTTPADVAVLLIGVNDTIRATPTRAWREDLGAVLDTLAARARIVAITGVPPFDAFPSLPRTLATHLAGRGRRLDTVARELCAARETVIWTDSAAALAGGSTTEGFFAADGFHPSPAGYRIWADAVAEQVKPPALRDR